MFPAQCQINAPTFNFGRAPMSAASPPIDSVATISVTCTRHPQDRLSVDVEFELKALPAEPNHFMRDEVGGAYLRYHMYVDAARTRYWGDGTQGTFTFSSTCLLDEKNRVCTLPFLLYARVAGNQQLVPNGQFLGSLVSRVEYRFLNCRP